MNESEIKIGVKYYHILSKSAVFIITAIGAKNVLVTFSLEDTGFNNIDYMKHDEWSVPITTLLQSDRKRFYPKLKKTGWCALYKIIGMKKIHTSEVVPTKEDVKEFTRSAGYSVEIIDIIEIHWEEEAK